MKASIAYQITAIKSTARHKFSIKSESNVAFVFEPKLGRQFVMRKANNPTVSSKMVLEKECNLF